LVTVKGTSAPRVDRPSSRGVEMTVVLTDLVIVSDRMMALYDEALEATGVTDAEIRAAVRTYAEREDWPTKTGVRVFAAGDCTDHRNEKVQAVIEVLAESLSCPAYSALMGLHCPYMGRLALAAARARTAKAVAA